MTDVEHLVEMIAALVRAGKSPLQAVKDIAMLLVSNPDGEVLLRKACSDPKKLDTKEPVLILALVLAAASTSLPQIQQA